MEEDRSTAVPLDLSCTSNPQLFVYKNCTVGRMPVSDYQRESFAQRCRVLGEKGMPPDTSIPKMTGSENKFRPQRAERLENLPQRAGQMEYLSQRAGQMEYRYLSQRAGQTEFLPQRAGQMELLKRAGQPERVPQMATLSEYLSQREGQAEYLSQRAEQTDYLSQRAAQTEYLSQRAGQTEVPVLSVGSLLDHLLFTIQVKCLGVEP